MYALQTLQSEIEKEVETSAKQKLPVLTPPRSEMGDFSVFSKDALKIPNIKGIKEIKVMGPYHNFFIDYDYFAKEVLKEALKKDYGSGAQKERIVIEYVTPNPNKPLHMGHARNAALGLAVSNIFEYLGNKVFRTNWINDRGIHICKSMLAYQKWGNNETPESAGLKSDFFVLKYYVMFSEKAEKNPELEKEAQEMLKKWEAGDKEILALWKKMNSWAYDGWEYTHKKLGVKYDKWYYESDLYKKGKDLVEKGLKKGIFKKNETGAVYADLEKYGIPNKILLRSDATSLYIVPDLYLGEIKYEDFKMDKSIYCVGSDQELHFKQLFKMLELLGNKTKGFYHLSYGMVYLPEGKMSSRKGRGAFADDVIQSVEEKAKAEIEERGNVKDVAKLSEEIGVGAMKFALLNIDSRKDITFDKEKSVSFTGDTGPYVQYAYVRCSSILEKEKPKGKEFKIIAGEEKQLLKKLAGFPEIVESCAKNYTTHTLTNYLLELVHTYSSFYENCPVLTGENKDTRLQLVAATRNVLKLGLNLLGIAAPEKM